MVPVLAAAVLAAAAPGPAACPKTFTGPMITRAIDATYSGTHDVSGPATRRLRRYMRCARPHVNRAHIRRYQRHAVAAWQARRDPPMNGPVLASWYGDHGTGACGVGDVQSGYRFASLFLPCGEVIRMCHGSSCVDAEMSDHGPYVGGRTFDLNANLKAAIGCSDLCDVTWRPL